KRDKDGDVILVKILRKQLSELNPWMKNNPESIEAAIEKISEENFPTNLSHMETNEIIHSMYTEKSKGSQKPLQILFDDGHGEEMTNVKLFDFDEPEKNNFLVTNQLRFRKDRGSILPDIMIYVNGFPLVMIECKSPNIEDPMGTAVDDLDDYQESNNGADRLFFYNLFLIATSGNFARHGCIEANVNFYSKWSSTYPYSIQEVENLAKRKPREQENLIVGSLNKKTLMRMLEKYMIFDKVENTIIKKMPRHHQLRTVSKAVERLKVSISTSSNLGGTVWHSQGSGKSLTMFWLAKEISNLNNIPIIVVTDRTSLDDQIHKNFESAGWHNPIRADSADHLIEEMKNPDKKIIMTTIQKLGLKKNPKTLTDKPVVILTDESHRTQFGDDATRMRNSMRKGIFFAFTATPIKIGKRNVVKEFGNEIDTYSWAESIADEATVGIEYRPEFLQFPIKVSSKAFSEEFEKEFKGYTKAQKDAIREDKIEMNNFRIGVKRIKEISEFIVKDFNERVGINGFKAMIVASNREAAVRYKNALDSIAGAPKSIVIMSGGTGESGLDGDSWDKYHLSKSDKEIKSKEFAKKDDDNKILIVSDMLLTGYDAPILDTLYLDHKLKQHTLLQAIARVNRKYSTKQFGTVFDLINVGEELAIAKKMFDADQVNGITVDRKTLLSTLKGSHLQVMTDVKGIDPSNPSEVLERFSKKDKIDKFYTHYVKFEKALDAVMPDPEAEKYLKDYANLKIAVIHLRNFINNKSNKFSTKQKEFSKRIQRIVDKYVTVQKINIPIPVISYDDENFGIEVKKLTPKAQNAAAGGQLGTIIELGKPANPAFYKDIEEQLNNLVTSEEEGRITAEQLFESLTDLREEARKEGDVRKELGLKTIMEFAIYGELKQIVNEKELCVKNAILIYKKILPLTQYVDCFKPEKTAIRKEMEKSIYEILSDKFPENRIDDLTEKIIDLFKKNIQNDQVDGSDKK
ncbi:MAG: type I restriction endonuclease subunit R, partial [Candidatus Nitrosopelagicus sp.]|nr:type I restriction endonuclease subunit R [Candidatus Nitrosopelagicus sp.]